MDQDTLFTLGAIGIPYAIIHSYTKDHTKTVPYTAVTLFGTVGLIAWYVGTRGWLRHTT